MNKVKYLLTYRYAEIIHDLTVQFTKKYINLYSRTRDQMDQAARSGKQNIVEGVGQGQTSKRGEIKLLGVSKASFEELLMDFEDYLRQNDLEIYSKESLKVSKMRQYAFRITSISNLSDLGSLKEKPFFPGNPQDAANFLLTLCHQITYLLDKQIKAMEEKFIKEGGFTENLLKKRLSNR